MTIEAGLSSFVANDLARTTKELSRDDYTKFSKNYEDKKILTADSFGVLNQEGVGKLTGWAVENGSRMRPEFEVGICGEPSSVEFRQRSGMDYLSVSPCRVPTARLAATQAAITKGDESEANRTA